MLSILRLLILQQSLSNLCLGCQTDYQEQLQEHQDNELYIWRISQEDYQSTEFEYKVDSNCQMCSHLDIAIYEEEIDIEQKSKLNSSLTQEDQKVHFEQQKLLTGEQLKLYSQHRRYKDYYFYETIEKDEQQKKNYIEGDIKEVLQHLQFFKNLD
ncbi:UNKNOWN [Stylonychia lemnae]|uniref:Uncharacterized protein n=1 Tax=Stylonychia lemnae TaxID=5949 RepID=A0A078AUI4_STYLE|nr:UNKNOWN [Stylonychia lemnae]|eukprot:CDW84872.1 UNKNOWN [Stylonychia lemnae]